jgi:MOSC domain-containing protein YiiM
MSGRVEAIWLKSAHGGPMEPTSSATAVADKGLEGDANFAARRQVTVIEKETFDRIMERLGDARPYMRRANVMVSGVGLEETRDQLLSMGGLKIRIRGETRPCGLMDEQCPGLRDALDGAWGGGVHGTVLEDGEVRVGDPVSLEAAVATEA